MHLKRLDSIDEQNPYHQGEFHQLLPRGAELANREKRQRDTFLSVR
jgi:hypothetical protein